MVRSWPSSSLSSVLGLCGVLLLGACERGQRETRPPLPPPSRQPAQAGQLSFGHGAVTRGQVVVESARADTVGTARFRGMRPMDMSFEVKVNRRSELLELRNEVPQKMRVTYGDRMVRTWTSGGGHSTEPRRVVGNTYLVDRRGSTVFAEREGRGEIGSGELAILREDLTAPTLEISVLHTLRGRTVRFGQTVVVADPEPVDPKLRKRVELTLVDTSTLDGATVAVFDLTMRGGEEGSSYELRGEALVEIETARLRSYRGRGPVDVDDDAGTVEGTLTVESTYEYPKARVARGTRRLPQRRTANMATSSAR